MKTFARQFCGSALSGHWGKNSLLNKRETRFFKNTPYLTWFIVYCPQIYFEGTNQYATYQLVMHDLQKKDLLKVSFSFSKIKHHMYRLRRRSLDVLGDVAPIPGHRRVAPTPTKLPPPLLSHIKIELFVLTGNFLPSSGQCYIF